MIHDTACGPESLRVISRAWMSDADVRTFGRSDGGWLFKVCAWMSVTDVCDGGRDGACREEVSMIARLWTRRRGD